MAGMLLATVLGNLGRDAELRYQADGSPFATFSVAVSRKWTDSQMVQHEETEWVRVRVRGKMALTADDYLKKGKLVLVSGLLSTRTWEGRDGEKRFSLELLADKLQMCGSPHDYERPTVHGNEPEQGIDQAVLDEAIAAGEYEETLIPGF